MTRACLVRGCSSKRRQTAEVTTSGLHSTTSHGNDHSMNYASPFTAHTSTLRTTRLGHAGTLDFPCLAAVQGCLKNVKVRQATLQKVNVSDINELSVCTPSYTNLPLDSGRMTQQLDVQEVI